MIDRRDEHDGHPGSKWVVAVPQWHPTKLNDLIGRHWGPGSRKKKFDREIVGYSCLGAGVTRATGRRVVSLQIVLGPRQRGADPDAYWKSLLDALVACGALRDDDKGSVVLGPVTYSRAKKKATFITIEEAPQ